jgi:hypothetical protein
VSDLGRGWVRLAELAKEAGVARVTIWRIAKRLNAERLRRHAPPLLRRMGPNGGVLEVRVALLRLDLQEGTESLAERADALDWRLRKIERGQGCLRRAVDQVGQRLADHICRQDKVEAATEKTMRGFKSSIEGLSELSALRTGR